MNKQDKAIQTENIEEDEEKYWRPGPSAEILKLHAVACEDLFEYLNLKDLISLGLTCPRMYRLTKKYFQQNYATRWYAPVRAREFDIYISNQSGCLTLANGFNEHLGNVHIRNEHNLKKVAKYCTSVKCLRFDNFGTYKKINISHIKNALKNVEFIISSLSQCDMYESIFKYTPKLKMLVLTSPANYDWLLQKYEMLEYVTIDFAPPERMKIFLENNKTIQSLTMTDHCLKQNANIFKSTNETVNELGVNCMFSFDFIEVFELLKELHNRGFYKRLHLIMNKVTDDSFDLLKLPSLEKLTISIHYNNTSREKKSNFPILPNIRHVLNLTQNMTDLNTIIGNFRNLERILLWQAAFDHIFYLAQHHVHLKEIIIGRLIDDTLFNVFALNEARKKLDGAKKLIIYIDDRTYLRSKWIYGYRDFELIEVKLIGSIPSMWDRQYFG